jgi:maltooligosyltrehalose trehalohydrolase
MHEFRVWAPKPGRVEVVLGDQRLPMQRFDDGWWSRRVEEAGPGTRYAFSLDGGKPLPDPRSALQPEGVHGPSELVDPSAFVWHDRGWRGPPLAGSIIYELHVGTFSEAGTFEGVIEHLPHLVELGIDAIELLPVAEFPGGHGWGYDGVDLFAPFHAYGGPEGLVRLVDACHAAGLGVVMDVVYNHLGPDGNYLPQFGPYFTDRHHTLWGDAVNFDGPESHEVRSLVVDNALMWLSDYHLDGLRLDAVHAIADGSAIHILEQLAAEVKELAAHVRKPLFVIAESDLNEPRIVACTEAGGMGLDAAWADDFHHALHANLTGERSAYYEDFGSIAKLAKALRQAWVLDGTWSSFRGRVHGRPATGIEGHRFVVCTQNHDQVGNRARGERLSALVSPGRLKIAAAMLLTSPFVPLLFQGEEWGAATPFMYFTDHQDPDLAEAVRKGRRQEFASFGWDPEQVPDPQDQSTFEGSKLNWTELQAPEHMGLLRWYRELIAIRKSNPALTDGRLERVSVTYDEGEGWLTVQRGPFEVAVNLAPEEIVLPSHANLCLIAASDRAVALSAGILRLPSDSVAILKGPKA